MVIVMMFTFMSCGSQTQKTQEFYDLVCATQELLDIVADDIYTNWYDAIYKKKYNSDIDTAIYYALLDNSENIDTIELNNETIKDLYKKIRNSDLELEIKDVMHAYNDYYAFVIEVSGSFETFKQSKEPLKKALASALKNLAMEL